MVRLFCGLLALVIAGAALAEEKKEAKKDAPKLTGTWEREVDGRTLQFKFEEKTVAITVSVGDNGMTATADYTVDKDGKVKGKITKIEEKGTFPAKPAQGLEFTFKIAVKDKKATVSEFKSEHEGAAAVIEGEYSAK